MPQHGFAPGQVIQIGDSQAIILQQPDQSGGTSQQIIQLPPGLIGGTAQLAGAQNQAISLSNGLQGVYMMMPSGATTTAANNLQAANLQRVSAAIPQTQASLQTATQAASVASPSVELAEEEPLYVNAKQYS